MNSLLEDIEAELHNHLLEAGNLLGKRKSNLWTGAQSWKEVGTTARILAYKCRCGTYTEVLQGVFRKEMTPSGLIRETAIDPTATTFLATHYTITTQQESINLCPNCVPRATC